ncbi:MAG: NUDIX domain-containing protein [Candidatus Izemoplasmatales bacterium]|nr:NUDIX domain-containing protein [Candidatus Izemoplasmatales bacterium]
MNPLFVIMDTLVEIPPKIQTREVVRAVIMRGSEMLLMFSSRDQMFGTPGGGIGFNESKLDALYRETLEEVGAAKVKILEHLGFTEEIRESRSQMRPMKILTDYYHIEVPEFVENSLEEHEEEMGLVPMWVNLDVAIETNKKVLANLHEDKLSFYTTQTQMLQYFKDRFVH